MTAKPNLVLAQGAPEHAPAIPSLIWATGPSSYQYIFGDRDLFNLFIERCWRTPDTYFGYTEATVALRGQKVVGVQISFDGQRGRQTRDNLQLVWTALLHEGSITMDQVEGIIARAGKASYLNPYVPGTAWYLLALSVTEDTRGTGIGARLLAQANQRARRAECAEFHLDVLSDNPAVGFYQAHGLVTVAETIAPEPCRVHGIPMEMRMVLELTNLPATAITQGASA